MAQTPVTWQAPFTLTQLSGVNGASRIVQLANGNVLVVWRTLQSTGDLTDIFSQQFDRMGGRVGPVTQLNQSSTANDETDPDIAALPNGGFVHVYSETGTVGTSIRLERTSVNGTVTSSVVALDATAGDPTFGHPTVTVSSSTSALVVYERVVGGVASIVGRAYNPTTNTLGSEFSILSSGSGNQSSPVVVALTNGNFVIASNADTPDASIVYRIVTAAGVGVANATVTGTNTNGVDDVEANITALANGGFVISWTSGTGATAGVKMQVFGANGVAVSGVVTAQDGIANVGAGASEVAALADGTFLLIVREGSTISAQHYSNSGAALGQRLVTDTNANNVSDVTAVTLADGRVFISYSSGQNPTFSTNLSGFILDLRDGATVTPDLFIGTGADEVIDTTALTVGGGGGDDIIHERVANSSLAGGDGDDVIVMRFPAGPSLGAADGGAGNDTIDWSAVQMNGGDFDMNLGSLREMGVTYSMRNFENFIGTRNFDLIKGGVGDNRIFAGGGGDTVLARQGNDTVFGGDGSDDLRGDEGNDTLVGNDQPFIAEHDILNGGEGDDILYGEGVDTIIGGAGFDSVISVNSFNWKLDMGVSSIEYAILDFGDDLVNAETQTQGVSVFASGGADNIRGSAFADLLFGGSGADIIRGGAAADAIVGEEGADFLDGGAGDDRLYIDVQDVMIDGGEGYDAAYITPVAGLTSGLTIDLGLTSLEFIQDTAGFADTITVTNSAGPVSIFGGGGADRLSGGAGADFIFGELGNDILEGGAGADLLSGGAGADILIGGDGRDTLHGGANDGAQDIFRFFTDVFGTGSTDTIFNFVRGQDKLDFSNVRGGFSQAELTVVNGSTHVEINGSLMCIVIGVTGMTAADMIGVRGVISMEVDVPEGPVIVPEFTDGWAPSWEGGDPMFDVAVSVSVAGRETAAWYL